MPKQDADIKAGLNGMSLTGAQPSSPRVEDRVIKIGSVVVLVVIAVAAASMAMAFAFLFAQRSVQSLRQTAQPAIVMQPITSTVSIQPSYEDWMATQKTVLELTGRAVESINRTADMMLTVNAFLFTVMTAAGVGAIWRASAANDKAVAAVRSAKEAVEQAEKAKKTLQDIVEHSEQLQQEQSSSAKRMAESDKEIARLRKLTRDVKREHKRVMALIQLDEHGMHIRSGEPSKLWKSVSAVLEMSGRPKAIIRRKAVKVLGSLEECDPRVIERLEEIAAEDRARGVQQEAKMALERLRRLCDEAGPAQDEKSSTE